MVDDTEELEKIAEEVDGELHFEYGEYFIRIDTFGYDASENEDDMFDTIQMDIIPRLKEWQILDSWSDHDTQIITFVRRIT